MKKTWTDRMKDLRLNLIRQLVKLWMFFDTKVSFYFHDGFTPKRKEPYLLLSNHTFMFDVIHSQVKLVNPPYAIASRILFVRQPTKFLLTKVGNAIPKSKGAADLKAVKDIFRAVKRGYPIVIFPEGDTTFYGETNYIEESTYKLIKKLKLDVVTINIKGGYLSKPRWATSKRKNRRAEFHYHVTIRKDDIKDLSIDQIKEKVKLALYNNDYEYQRKNMIKHPGDALAEGLENIVYACPNCEAINSIETKGNDIICTSCNTKGHMNEYGFIEGYKFDNLVEWDHFQRNYIEALKKDDFASKGELFYSDFVTGVNTLIGNVEIRYKSGKLTFNGDHQEVIDIDDITNPTIALRRDLNFTYNHKNYLVKLQNKSAAFLRVLQRKY